MSAIVSSGCDTIILFLSCESFSILIFMCSMDIPLGSDLSAPDLTTAWVGIDADFPDDFRLSDIVDAFLRLSFDSDSRRSRWICDLDRLRLFDPSRPLFDPSDIKLHSIRSNTSATLWKQRKICSEFSVRHWKWWFDNEQWATGRMISYWIK